MPNKEINLTTPVDKGLGGKLKQIDRTKLHGLGDMEGEGDGSSLRAIVLLVVVILAVALGGAYLIRNIKQSQPTIEPTPTPTEIPTPEATPEPTLADTVLSQIVLADVSVENAPAVANYVAEDTKFSNTSEATYTLKSVFGQPYESFYRVTFTFTAGETAETKVPNIDVNYRNVNQQIELTFGKTTADESGFELGGSVVVDGSVLASISKTSTSTNETLVYQLVFDATTDYLARTDENTLILDIKEPVKRELVTPTTTPEASPTVTPTATVDATVTPTENTDETGTLQIQSNTNGQVLAAISGYSFEDAATKFTYMLKLADENVPAVSVSKSADGLTVTFTIEDLKYDSLPKNGVGYRDFSALGVANVKELNITRTGSTSVYEFTLTETADYKVYLDTDTYDENRIMIEIVHG